MEIRYVLAAAAAFAFCGGASAQTLKPGLWEVTNDMKTGSGQMEKGQIDIQKQMANMSPEQKKMVQDMMAKQGNDKVARKMEAAHRTRLAEGLVGIREQKRTRLSEFINGRFEPCSQTGNK